MTIRPVDIEKAAVAYLADVMPTVTAGTARPAGTDWQAPFTPVVRVQVVGGGEARGLVLDDAVLSVEVWDADSVTAADLASQACGHFDAWSGSWAGALIYRAAAARPRSVPDPGVPGVPRYVFTVQATARRIGA